MRSSHSRGFTPHLFCTRDDRLHQNRKGAGFTLLELLVVVAIIALLTAVALVSLDYFKARARDSRRVANINQLKDALQIYYAHHEKYPDITVKCINGIDDDLTKALLSDQINLSPIADPLWPATERDTSKVPEPGHCYSYTTADPAAPSVRDPSTYWIGYFLELSTVGIPGHNDARP